MLTRLTVPKLTPAMNVRRRIASQRPRLSMEQRRKSRSRKRQSEPKSNRKMRNLRSGSWR